MTHPQNCGTCKNKVCEYYKYRGLSISTAKFPDEYMASPSVVTSWVGCASWSNGQPQQGEPDCEIICPNCRTLIIVDKCGVLSEVRSHPYQSERDKVLDELEKRIDECAYEVEDRHNCRSMKMHIDYSDLRRIIAELRQAGEQ